MSDPEHNPQFRRAWTEPEKPPPKAKRPAPVAFESQPPQLPLSNNQNLYNSRSAAAAPRRDLRMANKPGRARNHSIAARSKTAPRHKRRPAPSFKLVKIGRKLLDPRPRR